MKRLSLPLACFFSLVLAPNPALAHGLDMETRFEKGKLIVSAFYDDDTDAVGARVQLVSGSETLASAKTDAKGRCTFEIPPAGKYQIVVDAGAGHRTEKAITIPANIGRTPAADPSKREASKPRTDALPETSKDVVGEGPSRVERAAYPWLKIGVGIGVIVLLALAFIASRIFRAPG